MQQKYLKWGKEESLAKEERKIWCNFLSLLNLRLSSRRWQKDCCLLKKFLIIYSGKILCNLRTRDVSQMCKNRKCLYASAISNFNKLKEDLKSSFLCDIEDCWLKKGNLKLLYLARCGGTNPLSLHCLRKVILDFTLTIFTIIRDHFFKEIFELIPKSLSIERKNWQLEKRII